MSRNILFSVAASLTMLAAAQARDHGTMDPGPETYQFTVHTRESLEPMKPIWAFVGYDEPNYTYMKDGTKLLTELAQLSPVPVNVRCHNLLTSGDGTASLKWGSTNAYTEDRKGRPVYDWTIVDRIFDTYVSRGMKPLVEIGFMPEAMSINPQPYKHEWSPADQYSTIYTGWTYAPKDWDKWRELVYQWARHCVERYGEEEVSSWYWEVWNEPDIAYWSGSHEDFCKLYDYAADGLKKALPAARIGGPETTDPGSKRAMDYLTRFLDHCRDGINYATGQKGAPLDFITFHAKGGPQVLEDHVRMNIGRQLRNIDLGFAAVASYPEFKDLPIIIGESDPEGCAACSVDYHPSNDYRNGTMYSSYSANTYARTYELARKHGVNVAGAVAWAFEFEDQKWFAGFRDLATNGVDKPVLNVFRMFGLMQGGDLVKVEASRPMSADDIVASSVRENPDVSAIASSDGESVSIMVWNYHDDDLKAAPAEVSVVFDGLECLVSNDGSPADRVLLSQYRIDDRFSNSFETWKALGSPQSPTPEQYRILEQSGQLQMYTSPTWMDVNDGKVSLTFQLPRQGVALVRITR